MIKTRMLLSGVAALSLLTAGCVTDPNTGEKKISRTAIGGVGGVVVGGLLGGLIAWVVFNGYSVATLGSNFSQVVFQFKVTPELLWSGLKWALGIGLVGGLFPALRAARLPITQALRAI